MTAWRQGNHQPQNLYAGEDYVGVMFTPRNAERVVAAMNGRAVPEPPDPARVDAIVEAALNHALVAYDFNPNDPGLAPLGFARAAVEHAMKALRGES